MSTTTLDTTTVRRWKRYQEYRPANLDWLEGVPSHWQILPLKRRARIRYGLGQPPAPMPEGLPLIRATNVKRGRIADEGMMYVDPAEVPASRDAVLCAGDIIVVRSGAYTGDSAIIPPEYAGAIAGYDMVVRAMKDHPPYLGWQFLSPEIEDHQFQLVKLRAAQPHLNAEELGETIVCLPPLAEQRAIATFLDEETARIDALIGHKERLVALLEEKRQAIISHAVTRGLDPATPLKDSGVPWLGMVPKHWRMMRIADLACKITNGFVGPTRDILIPEGVRYLQSLHIKEGEIRFDKPYYVSQEWSDDHQKSILREGDVLIVQTGDIGQVAAVPREYASCNCHALIVVQMKPGYGSGFFLSAFLRSQYGRQTLLACQTGATHPHLECGKVREISVAIPPVDEQNAIVSYLDRATTNLRDAELRIEDGIARLQEYRTALISAAVTGQIDVRGEVTI